MNFSNITTAPSVSSILASKPEDEGKLVAFIICALRSGIPKHELFAYLIKNKSQLELVTRDKCVCLFMKLFISFLVFASLGNQ